MSVGTEGLVSYEERLAGFEWGAAWRELGLEPGGPVNIGAHCSDRICTTVRGISKGCQGICRIRKVVDLYRRVKRLDEEIKESQHFLVSEEDEEMKRLAKEELNRLTEERGQMEEDLRVALLPKDPNDEKNILLEIRAGTGGDEAGLFASDLFRMYSKFAEKQGWRLEGLNRHCTGVAGFEEIIALIEGKGVYSRVQYESGVHRVQRVPTTETQGRIHTSTVNMRQQP